MRTRVVILSTADYESPVWTNKQHLALGLAETEQVEIVYVESLGLRQPKINPTDFMRVARKLRKIIWVAEKRPTGRNRPENLRIVSPVVIPLHRFAVVRFVNKILLKLQLSKYTKDVSHSTLWTFSPLTYGLEKEFDRVVYHSVDLLHTLPGVPHKSLLQAEENLVGEADVVIASSTGVESHLISQGAKDVLLWENVARVDIFSESSFAPREPAVVFAGNLTSTKLDSLCFESILSKGIKIYIAGPQQIDGTETQGIISTILEHPLVEYVGNLGLEELAALFGRVSVGIIPYQLNEYTEGVFPMKVYEYLAAGLLVVSTPLHSLSGRQIDNLQISSVEEFGDAVEDSLGAFSPETIEISRATAEPHSWAARIRDAISLLTDDTSGASKVGM